MGFHQEWEKRQKEFQVEHGDGEKEFNSLYKKLISEIHPDRFPEKLYDKRIYDRARELTKSLTELESCPVISSMSSGLVAPRDENVYYSWQSKLDSLRYIEKYIKSFLRSVSEKNTNLPEKQVPKFLSGRKFREICGREFSGFCPDNDGRLFWIKDYNEETGEAIVQISCNTEEGKKLIPFTISFDGIEKIRKKEASFVDLLGQIDTASEETIEKKDDIIEEEQKETTMDKEARREAAKKIEEGLEMDLAKEIENVDISAEGVLEQEEEESILGKEFSSGERKLIAHYEKQAENMIEFIRQEVVKYNYRPEHVDNVVAAEIDRYFDSLKSDIEEDGYISNKEKVEKIVKYLEEKMKK